jgi:hypothetical protein
VANFSPDLGEAEEVTGNVEHLAPLGDALVFAKVEDDLLTISFIVLQNVGILFNNGWQNRGWQVFRPSLLYPFDDGS